MTTYTYLKKGAATKRPYHLLDEERGRSLCGVVLRSDAESCVVNTAPTPVSNGMMCLECQKLAEARDLGLTERLI